MYITHGKPEDQTPRNGLMTDVANFTGTNLSLFQQALAFPYRHPPQPSRPSLPPANELAQDTLILYQQFHREFNNFTNLDT